MLMETKKALAVAVVTALVGAILPTVVVLRMMADNNNNGEVYDAVTGRWDVGHLFSVSAVFNGASFLLIFAVVFGLARLWSSDGP